MSTNRPFEMCKFIDDCKNGREDNIAFLIGNGINRYYREGEKLLKGVSWEDSLLNIWREQTSDPNKTIPEDIFLTEFSDLIELADRDGKEFEKTASQYLKLTRMFCDELDEWEKVKLRSRTKIVREIKEMDFPILTTNFDNTMSLSIEASKLFRLKEEGKRKKFTHHYPWASYYSNKKLTRPNDGFAIWHIHGMKRYRFSMMLSFSHYITKMAYLKKRTRDVTSRAWEKSDHLFRNTWLDIFYHKRLFIFGIKLREQEIFLRWLLLQKARHECNNGQTPKGGWYVIPRCELGEITKGNRFFLESVGIQIHEVDDFEDIYETPWS